MVPPFCGTDLGRSSQSVVRLLSSKSFSVSDNRVPTNTPPPLPTEEKRSYPKILLFAGISVVCVALAARIQFVTTLRETNDPAEAAGAATSALVIPGVIASLLLISKRFRSLEMWLLVYAIVSGISVFALLNGLMSR